MTRKRSTIRQQASIAGFDVELSYKQMKTMRLKLQPPMGDIKVSVPFGTPFGLIYQFVLGQSAWIEQQRERLRSVPQLLVDAPLSHGADISIFGGKFKLNVIKNCKRKHVELDEKNSKLHLHLVDDLPQSIESELDNYYRTQMREKIPPLLKNWQPIVGKNINEWRIRKMKTRWGSCNISCHRIWLNLELAKKPLRCLEYVLVHELTHLHERYHNKRFYQLMDRFLPNWREIRSELN